MSKKSKLKQNHRSTPNRQKPRGGGHHSLLASSFSANFKWWLLGAIAFAYLLWFAIFGFSFMTDDFAEQISQAAGIATTTDQHSAFMNLLLQILLQTGIGVILYELIVQAALIYLVWHSLISLHNFGLSRKATLIAASAYCLCPMFFFIANFASKDQLFAAASLAFTVELYRILKIKNANKHDSALHFAILGSLFVLLVLLKTFFIIYILIFIACAILAKRLRAKFLITGACGFVLALALNFGFSAAIGAQSVSSRDMLSVPAQVTGAIFANPESQISQSERDYFNALYDTDYFKSLNPDADPAQWWQLYSGLLADKMKYPLWYANMSIPEYVAKSAALCFENFGVCASSYLTLMSGFYLPIEIQEAITGLHRNAHFVNYTSDNVDDYFSTVSPQWSAGKLCAQVMTDGAKDFAGLKQCIVDQIGDAKGDAVANSISPFVKASIFANSPVPGIAQAIIGFWDVLSIFLQGFWVFWISLALFIASYAAKKLRALRPLAWILAVFYFGLFASSPVAYERYLFPIYMILPFITAAFWLDLHPTPKPSRT